jgi:hypothetical protein
MSSHLEALLARDRKARAERVAATAARHGVTRAKAAEILDRVDLSADAAAGVNVIGRALAAGVITEADRTAARLRVTQEPGYQRELEQRIADAGGYTRVLASEGSPAGAAALAAAGKVSARHRNPLVALAMLGSPGRVAAASSDPVPTLFQTGDLPPFCASGIDPKLLLQVPWQARHALAAAPTQAAAYRLLQEYSGPEAEDAAEIDFGQSFENADYERRVREWQVTGMSEQHLYDSLGFTASDQAAAKRLDMQNDAYLTGRGAPLPPSVGGGQ